MIILQDRVLRGGIAGVVGQAIMDGWIHFSFYVLHFSKARWTDAVSSVLWGHPARNVTEFITATLALLIIGGMVGGAYAWLVLPRPGAGNYIGRAIGTGLTFWVIGNVAGSFFRIPHYHYILWQTTFTRISGVLLWATAVGLLMRKWDQAFDEKAVKSVEAEHEAGGAAALQRSTLMEVSDELGAVSKKLDKVAEELHRLTSHQEEGCDERREDDDSWRHVEHLGFKVLRSDEEKRED